MRLAGLYFPVLWRNEYSVACLTRKLQGLVLLYWTSGLSDCKVGNIFCSCEALMLAWTQAQSLDLDCFFLPFFTFYETFLCFLVVKLKKWQRTCLQGLREGEATGREHGILSMASFKQNLFYFFLVWENFLLNMFLTETSWRNQLCRYIITGCRANEAPFLEIRRWA